MARYEGLGFFLHRVTPKRDYTPHTHDYYEMGIILEGTAINSIKDKSYSIGPGDVYIVGKGATHEISQIDRLVLYNVGFNNSAIRNIGNDLLQLPGFHALFSVGALSGSNMLCFKLKKKDLIKIKGLLDEMYNEYTQNFPGCNHFSRVFRQNFGLSPTEYRKHLWQEDKY